MFIPLMFYTYIHFYCTRINTLFSFFINLHNDYRRFIYNLLAPKIIKFNYMYNTRSPRTITQLAYI